MIPVRENSEVSNIYPISPRIFGTCGPGLRPAAKTCVPPFWVVGTCAWSGDHPNRHGYNRIIQHQPQSTNYHFHICIYIYTHTYIYIYIYIYMCVSYIHIYMHIYIHIHIHMCINMYKYLDIHSLSLFLVQVDHPMLMRQCYEIPSCTATGVSSTSLRRPMPNWPVTKGCQHV